jgi:hypothetical protein
MTRLFGFDKDDKFEEDTELKTLKDLYPCRLECRFEHTVNIKELRKEAIKWVKWKNEKYKGNESVQEFIKYFFNLTEEDLQ